MNDLPEKLRDYLEKKPKEGSRQEKEEKKKEIENKSHLRLPVMAGKSGPAMLVYPARCGPEEKIIKKACRPGEILPGDTPFFALQLSLRHKKQEIDTLLVCLSGTKADK